MTKKVAIQGEEASFHGIAAHQFFGNAIELVYCDTFSDTFAAVENGVADYAVCAIENSLFGSINQTYDLLVNYDFSIVGEVYLRIKQCLVTVPGASLSDITEVYSHPVALAQCGDYLDANLPNAKRLEYRDTAASIAQVKALQKKSVAGIGSQEAAEIYGMQVLAEEIETNQQNYTRFIVLESKPRVVSDADKTSLIVKTAHHPGALYDALGAFAKHGINLSKLQSRPIIGKAWHYIFYVDIEESAQHPNFELAIKELGQQDCQVTILGSYKNDRH
ncbi:MAG: prephenate dehydratase [Candidatus Saccharimonadales bacterium]